jgi:hypothetical protein
LDLDFAKDPETWKSVSGNITFLCGSRAIQRSTMQRIVALSVTEAALFAATNNVQNMLYTKRIAESLGLHMQLPMILEVDNKWALYLVPDSLVPKLHIWSENMESILVVKQA